MSISGQCLCHSVTLTLSDTPKHVEACHCSMCQTWGGGPLLGLEAKDTLTIEGEQHVSRYRSSEWAERGFCKECGTHLFYHYLPKNSYIVPAGLFKTLPSDTLNCEIFIDHKPSYYDFSGTRERLTAEQVFALFAE